MSELTSEEKYDLEFADMIRGMGGCGFILPGRRVCIQEPGHDSGEHIEDVARNEQSAVEPGKESGPP